MFKNLKERQAEMRARIEACPSVIEPVKIRRKSHTRYYYPRPKFIGPKRKRGPKVPSEKTKQAIALWLQSKTYVQIGKALGFSHQRAQQIIRPPKNVLNALKDRACGHCEHCHDLTAHGHAHHKERPPDTYNDLSNLEYLCIECHGRTHGLYFGSNGCPPDEFLATYGHLLGPYPTKYDKE